MICSVVIMGVAGSGKSSLGRAVADAAGMPVVEGDDFHSPASRDKMRQGIPLTDADRDGWLNQLGERLRMSSQGIVLTCSALKRSYRDRLRANAPGLRFVFLDIDRAMARARVAARADTHFFAESLVESQFETLESPLGEEGVLRVDAGVPLAALQLQVGQWLHDEKGAGHDQ